MASHAYVPKQQACAARVILVDDNEEFRAVIAKRLQNAGYSVTGMSNASAFLSEIATAGIRYDLAIVDVNLPDMQGDKIISWMKESELSSICALPVLVVTGWLSELPDALPIDGTAVEILRKPFRSQEFLETVNRLVQPGLRH